jgi:hypothetical protein
LIGVAETPLFLQQLGLMDKKKTPKPDGLLNIIEQDNRAGERMLL